MQHSQKGCGSQLEVLSLGHRLGTSAKIPQIDLATLTMADKEVDKALNIPKVRYSRVWEDPRTLSKALQIGPSDVVLCITRQIAYQ